MLKSGSKNCSQPLPSIVPRSVRNGKRGSIGTTISIAITSYRTWTWDECLISESESYLLGILVRGPSQVVQYFNTVSGFICLTTSTVCREDNSKTGLLFMIASGLHPYLIPTSSLPHTYLIPTVKWNYPANWECLRSIRQLTNSQTFSNAFIFMSLAKA